ncbi:putative LRR receptor-like serine/threonine-protein kinase [Camellia lanceoleosa]|uniref:LRR receptor-like serine/threonine-protein kinase n=1 Tax=Camellia lanceoleosa TaxID=1840588 RepID=A0ACC0GIR6_9ERIC|nr:putative LRR receptor-like serine/threonine-protein kinase [Camellia lanceoleosa]
MSLTGNNLLGNLPSSIGLWLPNFNVLYLGGNNLIGIIPESISNASKLTSLDLGNNAFTGSIPKSLGNLRPLQSLNFQGNNLTSGSSSSSPELSFLTSLVNCKNLKVLSITRNPLDGILPTTIGNLSASLEKFDANSCGIKRNIPSEIEFGLEGLVSTSCDVYSYGILLMETFTRVKPTDEMFFEDMTMKRWIRESLPNGISHVIDANLLKPEEEHLTTTVLLQCVLSIMELALSCSTESSDERINMKDVLATLKKVKLWYLANCRRG